MCWPSCAKCKTTGGDFCKKNGGVQTAARGVVLTGEGFGWSEAGCGLRGLWDPNEPCMYRVKLDPIWTQYLLGMHQIHYLRIRRNPESFVNVFGRIQILLKKAKSWPNPGFSASLVLTQSSDSWYSLSHGQAGWWGLAQNEKLYRSLQAKKSQYDWENSPFG